MKTKSPAQAPESFPLPATAADLPDSEVTHEQISSRARDLWQQNGEPSGRDEEFWLEAERQLRTSVKAVSQPTTPRDQGAGAVPKPQPKPAGGKATVSGATKRP